MSEINRRIAELRGWTEIEEEDWFTEDFDVYDRVEGLVGKNPIDGERYPIPDYEHDLNAAIELVKDVPFSLESLRHMEWHAVCGLGCDHEAFDPSPALAICKAWMLWKNAITQTDSSHT